MGDAMIPDAKAASLCRFWWIPNDEDLTIFFGLRSVRAKRSD
jgi:hypothetical protein